MKVTARQVADRLGIQYVVASGLLSHLEDVGKAVVVEKRFHESGRGKPTRVYEVDQNVVVNLGEDTAQVDAVVEPAVEPAVEAAVEAAVESVPEAA